MGDSENISFIRPFRATVLRELSIAWRHSGEIIQPLVFYVLIVSLFPLAISPDPKFLQSLAPGIIWIAALLSGLLVLDNIFRTDFENGTLEQIATSSHSPLVLLSGKILAHWIASGLPLLPVAAMLGAFLNLAPQAYIPMLLGLLIGTPAMSLIGAIGAALTVGLRRRNLLLTLIVLPLLIPILIFGTSATYSATMNQPWSAQLYFLGAILALSLTLAPLAVAASLKISLD